MTPQEAKEALKIEQIQIEGKAVRVAKFFEGISVANEALEKQTPKKATAETINRGIDISGEYDIDFNLCCPVCGGVVGTFEGEVDVYFSKYCPNCGQALDWGDSE